MRLFILIIALIAGFATAPALETDTLVSIVTCYPGNDIYELEGHTALIIRLNDGTDVAVHWGLFDFDAPGFVYRFVKGETDYMCGWMPWSRFVEAYRHDGRRVDEQVLDLTSEQKHRIVALLENNLQPQNRVYRYNYVKDNCATRPMQIIHEAIGDSLRPGPCMFDTWSRPTSFRDVMRFYHENYPWYQFGIDLALGSGIDYPLQPAEYSFAPLLLEQQIAGATLHRRHIARPIRTVVAFPADNVVEDPTPWYLTPMAVCWAIFLLLLWATIRDQRRKRVTKWVDALYFGIMGLAGLLLTFLIFVSVHEATSPNYLYIWLNPLCLIPVVFIWLKNGCKVVFCYQIINFAVVFTGLACWWWLPQSANAAFLPLVLGDLLRAGSYIKLTYKELRKNQ